MHQQYPVPLYVGRFRQCRQSEQDLTAFLARLKKDGILKHKISKANNEAVSYTHLRAHET